MELVGHEMFWTMASYAKLANDWADRAKRWSGHSGHIAYAHKQKRMWTAFYNKAKQSYKSVFIP